MKVKEHKAKTDETKGEVSEPAEVYNLRDNRPLNVVFKGVTVSTFEKMEEETSNYSRSLSYEQRIEFMYFLNGMYYDYDAQIPYPDNKPWGDIHIGNHDDN